MLVHSKTNSTVLVNTIYSHISTDHRIFGASFSLLKLILDEELNFSDDAVYIGTQVIRKFNCSPKSLLRKEVIQPHLPIRLPCYDFTPIINPTFDCCPLTVSSQASGVIDSHGVTGGVYKARERIHRDILIRDY